MGLLYPSKGREGKREEWRGKEGGRKRERERAREREREGEKGGGGTNLPVLRLLLNCSQAERAE